MRLRVNGKDEVVELNPDTPLLWVVRETLGLTGTKYGCGMAQCGACLVHLDGEAVKSCLMLAVQAYLDRHTDMTVLCIIDRESIFAATKFILCQKTWFKKYEAGLLEAYRANVWPMGATFEPHWCLVLALDTRLAPLE